MINLEKWLKENIQGMGEYTLVTENGKTRPVYFSRFSDSKWDEDLFLIDTCSVRRIDKVEGDIDKFCKEYMDECIELEEDTNVEEYIEEFVKPMILNGYFYEIWNWHGSPIEVKEVEDIKLMTEREILEWSVKHWGIEKICED